MKQTEKFADVKSDCTHCKICTEHCDFLKKYDIVIGDTEKLQPLLYHCFQCGVCTEVCPQQIDGKTLILQLRRERVEENLGKTGEKGYGMLCLEKKNYRFRNYRRAQAKSVLFPGCNFPSFYPKTMEVLVELLQPYGIGVAYDCCGKPIAELGMKEQEAYILTALEKRLADCGAEEAILLCPNCWQFLKGKLPVRMITIYEKLRELGIRLEMKGGVPVFLPCPDRQERNMLGQIQQFCREPLIPIEGIQCCGLGGCAAGKEPDLVKGFAEKAEKVRKKAADEILYKAGEISRTEKQSLAGQKCEIKHEAGQKSDSGMMYSYCASCAGNLSRQGVKGVRHVLAELLRTGETADIRHSLRNRIVTKWK